MPVPKGYRRKRFVKSYKRSCSKGSIRTIVRGKVRLLVCCPKGKWKKRSGRCKVGMRAISLDKPKSFGMSIAQAARKEKREHPWATWKTARQIAADHLRRKRR